MGYIPVISHREILFSHLRYLIILLSLPNLYQWPFANVSGAGGVCYGSNNIQKIERLSDLDILPILFFDSPMNSDYYTPHRTTLGKATIRELLDTLNVKKEFPYEILQEYNPLTYKRSIF